MKKDIFEPLNLNKALADSQFELSEQIEAYFNKNKELPWNEKVKIPEEQRELLKKIEKQYPTKKHATDIRLNHSRGRER